MAYSGGKDCSIALDRMQRQGHICVALLIAVDTNEKLSFLHCITRDNFEKISECLDIPLLFAPSQSKQDEKAVIKALNYAKEVYGAEAICSGDIDTNFSKEWIEHIGKITKLKVFTPLWKEDKYKLLDELFNRGFVYLFKVIDNNLLPETLLGKPLTRDCIELFEKNGVDVCGERGEYHTITVNGPIFKKELKFDNYNIRQANNYSIII